MSEDKSNDTGDENTPEDEDDGPSINITPFQPTTPSVPVDEAPEEDEGPELPEGLPPELAELIKQMGGEGVVVIGADGAEGGDLSALFGQRAAPLQAMMYHKHNKTNHDIVDEATFVVDLPKRVTEDEVSVSIDTAQNLINIEVNSRAPVANGFDYCPDVQGNVPEAYALTLPAGMTHPVPGTLSESDVEVTFDDNIGLHIKITATENSKGDQLEAIEAYRRQMRGMMGFQP